MTTSMLTPDTLIPTTNPSPTPDIATVTPDSTLDSNANSTLASTSTTTLTNAPPSETISPEIISPETISPETISPENTSISPADKALNTSIKLTGRMLNFTRLQIQGDDLDLIKLQLQKKLGKARGTKLLVLVSCRDVLDLAALWELLWDNGVQPIGLVTGKMDDQALTQHIAIFPADGERLATVKNAKIISDSPRADTPKTATPTTSFVSPTPSANTDTHALQVTAPTASSVEGDRVYTQIVRSGQSINHVGGDLILTNGLNAGAEAITDYSLHVYGKAEGRLVAGATGDRNARIFCLKFNPSLVSVAGTYCLRENIPTEFLEKAVQVSYEADKGLVFQLMTQ